MAEQTLPPIDIGHPAPQRNRVGLAALLFGIAAAPAAWNAQLLLSVSLSLFFVKPHGTISIVGIVFAIAGGVVAWQSWRHTFSESPGSAHHLLDRGEGRTRFMAMCGMLTSAVFLLALIFGTAAFFLVPLCGN